LIKCGGAKATGLLCIRVGTRISDGDSGGPRERRGFGGGL